jgi:hypothetical protein
VGYNETSKAYRVYIPKQRKTVVSRDVKFEEDFASRKSHEHIFVTKDEEQEALKVEPRSPVIVNTTPLGKERETVAPSTSFRRPRWFTQTLREAHEHVETPRSTFRKRGPSKKFPDYMALISNNLDSEPSNFQEAAN